MCSRRLDEAVDVDADDIAKLAVKLFQPVNKMVSFWSTGPQGLQP